MRQKIFLLTALLCAVAQGAWGTDYKDRYLFDGFDRHGYDGYVDFVCTYFDDTAVDEGFVSGDGLQVYVSKDGKNSWTKIFQVKANASGGIEIERYWEGAQKESTWIHDNCEYKIRVRWYFPLEWGNCNLYFKSEGYWSEYDGDDQLWKSGIFGDYGVGYTFNVRNISWNGDLSIASDGTVTIPYQFSSTACNTDGKTRICTSLNGSWTNKVAYQTPASNYAAGSYSFKLSDIGKNMRSDDFTLEPYHEFEHQNDRDANGGTKYYQTFAGAKKFVKMPLATLDNPIFSQLDHRVTLNWTADNTNYGNGRWAIYRDGTFVTTVSQGIYTYTDQNPADGSATTFPYEDSPTYCVYYVAGGWNEKSQVSELKSNEVSVNTTRTLPIRNLSIVNEDSRIVFTWTSDGYPAGWGQKFNIYVDNEDTPIYTITPSANQTSFQWEHRTTDQHSDRQNKMDGDTPYTEEPLNACMPHNYRIEGVIGSAVISSTTIEKKAVGSATAFYSLEATKGAYPGTVKLQWHVNMAGATTAKTYIVERRRTEKPDESWVTLSRLSSADDYVMYTDDTPLPGIFYDYRVTVEDKCDDGTIINSDATDTGFAQTTGTVSGRVTYGSSGSSVEGVTVMAVKGGNSGDDSEQYHAMHFTSQNGVVTWQYPSATYAAGKLSAADFAVQLWLYPEELAESKIIRLNGEQCCVGMDSGGRLTLVNGSATYIFDNAVLSPGRYNHVVLTRSGQTVTAIVLGEAAEAPVLNQSTVTLDGSLDLSGATDFSMGYFKGFVDDFRFWSRSLTEEEIMENYDHQLVGNERGLETYYTFDEGLTTQFFDYSREGTAYHQHHGRMGSNTQSSTHTPRQLKLKAKTDIDGNYVIQGIPFSGEGTIYNVTPVLNSHEFSPMKSSRFISTASLVHNSVDFTDVSSFEVKGTIYYAGTNIPVDSVTIQVDGRPVSRNNEMVTTNAFGEFTVDVPIGYHYISAVKEGHTFVDGGRIPADRTGLNDATMEFKNPLSGLLFYDNTLVPVAGRIVGGAIEGNKPIGFGQSKNTIGQAQITLEIPDTRYMLNAYEESNGLVSNGYLPVADNTPLATPADAASTGTGYRTGGALDSDAQRVVITTDAATGEFAVLLPPLDYKVVSVQMVNDEARTAYTFPAEQLPRIDASDPKTVLKDSIETEDGALRYFEYVASLQLTKHTQPVLSVKQKGRGEGVFGDAKAKYSYLNSSAGEMVEQEVDLYTVNGNEVTYNFGYPIFSEMGNYTFNLEGYELYTNYEKSATAADRVTKVPLKDMVVTVSNALSASQKVYTAAEGNGSNAGLVANVKDNQLVLDDSGKATYTWQAGLPNIQDPYTRRLNMTFNNGAGDYSWEGLDGIIFGNLPTGSNFTTKGPSQVDMVLHDPYGDASFATWEKGKVSITSTDTLKTSSNEINFNGNISAGPTLEFSEGIGFATITEMRIIAESNTGFTYTVQDDSINTHTTTIEATRAVSTSADNDMIGADADIYIGSGTNLLFGEARSVGLKGDGTGMPQVGVDNAITVSQELETTFFYTQYQIESKIIPDLIKIRNAYLITVPDMEAYQNASDSTMYVTELSADDEDFGMPGTYKKLSKKSGLDMVQYYNDEIASWEHQMAESERYKLSLFANSGSVEKKNLSFSGGVEVTETATTEQTLSLTTSHQHSYILDCSFDAGYKISDVGVEFHREQHRTIDRMDNGYGVEGVGSNGEEGTSQEDTETATFSYTLADSGTDDAFSINVYKASGNHGPVFRTMGGQTSCPYEYQEVTKYYEPGTELSAATVQIENPELICDTPLLTGVPTGGKAQFELKLTNNSNINADAYFDLVPVFGTNPKGAKLSLPTGSLQNGRTMFIPAGETITTILTLEQGNLDETDYEDIRIRLVSSCQNDEYSIHGIIASEVSLSAHFVPASTPVIMTIDRTVVNTNNIDDDLTVRVTGFDRQFAGLQRVDLQYMAPGSQTWSLLKGYIPNEDVRTDASQTLLPENGVIEVPLNMKSASWTDGTYHFRAQSSALYSGQPVTSESEELTVVRDLSRPQLFGLARPADGVLNASDEISVTFNEDIEKELLTKNNFVVSGVLNGAKVQHDVALSAQNTECAAYTEASINLARKSFSTDMWVRATGSGDVFTHGSGDERFTMSIDANHRLVVTIAGESYTSAESITENTWTFLTLSYSYEQSGSRLNVRAVTANDTKTLFADESVADYSGTGSIVLGRNFTGAIHDLVLWDKERTMQEAQAEMNYTKKHGTPNLIGYWKMDEGDGTVIRDYARNRHLVMPNNTWYLNNDNKAVSLNGNDALMIDISECSVLPTDDYAVELWFKGAKADNAAASTLFSTSALSMGFDSNGDLTMSAEDASLFTHHASLLDNAWHHLSLNVLRNGNATVYVDGVAVKILSASAVPAIEGASLMVGSQFKGAVDEIRMWNASMTGELLSRQRKERLTGEESGLVAYYSFEQMTRDANTGIISSVGSAADVTGSGKEAQLGVLGYTDEAPAMKVKPEATNVDFSYVANERGIILTLTEQPERLEGTTLTLNVRGVRDMNGNQSTPITWTAYVQQNGLLWQGDTELTLQKSVGETATFEAVITNESGNTENWSLSGLPAWLTASATSGTLTAQTQKAIIFTLAESVAIGKYEQTVYLTGNNNISEPLTLNVTVTGNVPDWAVNPHDYETSMNVIGVVKNLDGTYMTDEDDLLAAFIGEECRGLAHLAYNEIYDSYYVTMDIYGNDTEDTGKEVTFRAYDASTGTVYPEVTWTDTDPCKFVELVLLGSYANPKVFNLQNRIEQLAELKTGWNWISFTVAAEDMTVSELFKTIADDVVTVKGHDAYLTNDGGTWSGDMSGSLSTTAMYEVQMKADRQLRIVGTSVNQPVDVHTGWNWIGYYSSQVASLDDAFAAMTKVDGDYVKAKRGVAYWDDNNARWLGSLQITEPGKGYQLMSNAGNQSFSYPTAAASRAHHAPAFRAPRQVQTFRAFAPIDFHNYPDNAIMAVKVIADGKAINGVEVGVFADEECRKAAVTNGDGIAYLTIPGDEECQLTVKVAIGDNVVDAPLTLTYETDAVFGTPTQPLLIDLGEVNGIREILYNDGIESIYDLQGRKLANGKLSKGVYIINGQKKTVK